MKLSKRVTSRMNAVVIKSIPDHGNVNAVVARSIPDCGNINARWFVCRTIEVLYQHFIQLTLLSQTWYSLSCLHSYHLFARCQNKKLKRDSNDMRRRPEVRRTYTHVISLKTPNTRYPGGQCTLRPLPLMARYVFSEMTHLSWLATTCPCRQSLTFLALRHSRHVGTTPCNQELFTLFA